MRKFLQIMVGVVFAFPIFIMFGIKWLSEYNQNVITQDIKNYFFFVIGKWEKIK